MTFAVRSSGPTRVRNAIGRGPNRGVLVGFRSTGYAPLRGDDRAHRVTLRPGPGRMVVHSPAMRAAQPTHARDPHDPVRPIQWSSLKGFAATRTDFEHHDLRRRDLLRCRYPWPERPFHGSIWISVRPRLPLFRQLAGSESEDLPIMRLDSFGHSAPPQSLCPQQRSADGRKRRFNICTVRY
jgi:hypothetical protein